VRAALNDVARCVGERCRGSVARDANTREVTVGISVQEVDFVAVPTTDIDRAVAFYGETLGLEHRVQWGQRPAHEFQAGNLTLALMQCDAFNAEFSPNATPIALRVADVAAARAELEASGVVFEADTLDSGVCHMAFFSDPDGNPLILHRRYAPA